MCFNKIYSFVKLLSYRNSCTMNYVINSHIFLTILGNLTAGNFTEKTTLKGLRQCVVSCCITDTCNIVFIVETRCYHVECASDELCLPLMRTGSRKWDSHVSMILVKPVLPNGKTVSMYYNL